MCMCFACIYFCVLCMCLCVPCGLPRIKVGGYCELLWESWKLNSDSLQEQLVLLITEPLWWLEWILSHILRHANIWSPACDTLWGRVRRCSLAVGSALLRENFEVSKPPALPSLLLSQLVICIGDMRSDRLLQQCLSAALFFHHDDAGVLVLRNHEHQINHFLCKLPWP